MEAGVGDKETKRTKWRETRAATHSEQEQAKVNPRRENHFTAVTETTEKKEEEEDGALLVG